MLDVASPTATSSQDVSRPGDHADTATTTPESTASTNIGGPVNQTPSSSASSAPSNLDQLNPVSDLVADGASGDLSSTTSSSPPSSNAVSNPAMAENALETSSFSADLASTNSGNFDAMAVNAQETTSSNIAQDTSSFSDVAHTSSFSDLASTNSGAVSQSGALENGVSSGNGDLTMSQPSVQAVSSQANAMVNTLESNLSQNVAAFEPSGLDSTGSILPADGNGRLAFSTQGVSSQANILVNTLEPNLNIPQTSDIIPVNMVADLAPSVQGVSTQSNAMANTLGSNVPLTSSLNAIGTNVAEASSQADTLGSNLNIVPQNGAAIGNNVVGGSSSANLVVSTLGSITPQNSAIPLPSASDSIGTDFAGVSSQGNILVGSNSDIIPQNGATIGTNAAGGSSPANLVVTTLGSNIPVASSLNAIGTNVAGSSPADLVVNNLGSNIPQNSAIPRPSILDPIGINLAGASPQVDTLGSKLNNIPQNGVAIGTNVAGDSLPANLVVPTLGSNTPLASSLNAIGANTAGVSSKANTLGSNLNNIPQDGAAIETNVAGSSPADLVTTLGSNISLASNLNAIGANITGVSSKANTLGSNLNNIPQDGAAIETSVAGSSPADLVVTTLGSNIPQPNILDPTGTNLAGVSPQADTLGSNLNIIPQNGAAIGTNVAGDSSPANLVVTTLESNIPLASSLNAIGTNITRVSSQTNTLGSNLDIIPQNGATIGTNATGGSSPANLVVTSLGSNTPLASSLNAIETNVVGGSSYANTLGSNLNFIPQNVAIPLSSGSNAIGSTGTDVVGSTIPMSSLTSSVQAASNTISDPLRLSFTNLLPDSLNTPQISNGVEISPSLLDHIEANTATTTTGNCICKL